MPERKSGRRNDGKFCLSDGSGVCGGYAGPVVVLGRGYYRGETLKIFREAYKMFENLKKAIISNGWKFPEWEIKRWYAGSANGDGSVSSGIVQTQHYGKVYFNIISPWAFCPEGEVIIERA